MFPLRTTLTVQCIWKSNFEIPFITSMYIYHVLMFYCLFYYFCKPSKKMRRFLYWVLWLSSIFVLLFFFCLFVCLVQTNQTCAFKFVHNYLNSVVGFYVLKYRFLELLAFMCRKCFFILIRKLERQLFVWVSFFEFCFL